MDINDFDKIIKEQMSKLEITPSSEVKRKLALILFFSNLLVFHKVKLIAALFLIGGGVYVGANYFNAEENLVSLDNTIDKNEQIESSVIIFEETASLQNDANAKEFVESDNIVDSDVSSHSVVQTSSSYEKSNNNSKSKIAKTITEIDETGNQDVLSVVSSVGVDVQDNKNTSDSKKIPNQVSNENHSVNELTEQKKNYNVVSAESSIQKPINNTIKEAHDPIIEKAKIIPPGVETVIQLDNSLPATVVVPHPNDDYANEPKKRGVTFDCYFSPYNKVDIDNQLETSLQDYNWDFYKEHGYVNSGLNGGLNFNYNWNNFKMGSGVQMASLRDYKSGYKYYYLSGLMGLVGKPVSGAVVYGEDTTLVFSVDPQNKELHKEIESQYNTYTYLRVPLTLGYEIGFKYFSLELNAGMEYGYLVKAKGVEVKNKVMNNDSLSVYFYKDKYMDLVTRKSENFNKHQFAMLGNATLRVRLTPSFDLYSSFNYSQSLTSVYADNYFLQKKYKNYGLKFGVTYYLNKRLKLKENQAIDF